MKKYVFAKLVFTKKTTALKVLPKKQTEQNVLQMKFLKRKSAKTLQRNCSCREYKQWCWVPSLFYAKFWLGKNGFTKNQVKYLQNIYRRTKSKTVTFNLNEELHSSEACLWHVESTAGLGKIVKSVKSILKKTVTESSKVSNSANRADAVQRGVEIIEPLSLDFIEYGKGYSSSEIFNTSIN